jgi:hypothetical protein
MGDAACSATPPLFTNRNREIHPLRPGFGVLNCTVVFFSEGWKAKVIRRCALPIAKEFKIRENAC